MKLKFQNNLSPSSFRGAQRRDNPFFSVTAKDGLPRYARNDGYFFTVIAGAPLYPSLRGAKRHGNPSSFQEEHHDH